VRLISSTCHSEAGKSHSEGVGDESVRSPTKRVRVASSQAGGGESGMKKQSKRDWCVRSLRQTAARASTLRHGRREGWTCHRVPFSRSERQGRQLGSVLILGMSRAAERRQQARPRRPEGLRIPQREEHKPPVRHTRGLALPCN